MHQTFREYGGAVGKNSAESEETSGYGPLGKHPPPAAHPARVEGLIGKVTVSAMWTHPVVSRG
ncbi:hypothetical protein J6590_005778 [Homalodisca vitripennis]|nr:hypothetical protein J6590_005778 [Homalodisca vitripennis]